MSLPDIEAFIEQKIPVTRFDPDMLIAVPTKRVAPANGGAEKSIVEDAIADAAAERKRRRERDGRTGKGRTGQGRAGQGRASGGRSRSRQGDSKRGDESKRDDAGEGKQRQRHASDITDQAKAKGERGGKRRRRPRREHDKEPSRQQAGGSENRKKANGGEPKSTKTPPKLQTRIKRTIKSLVNRLGMGGG